MFSLIGEKIMTKVLVQVQNMNLLNIQEHAGHVELKRGVQSRSKILFFYDNFIGHS